MKHIDKISCDLNKLVNAYYSYLRAYRIRVTVM